MRGTWPGPTRGKTATSRAVHPVDAGNPPVPALYPSPGAFRSRPGSTGPASWTESWSTHPPSTSAVRQCPPSHPPWASPTCSSRPCSPLPASHRTRMTSRWWPCSGCSACGSSRLPERTSPTSAKSTATGSCGYAARAPRSSWFRCPQLSAGPSTRRPESGREGRSCSTATAPVWTGTRPPAVSTDSPRPPASRSPGRIRTCSDTLSQGHDHARRGSRLA